ncbi:MAG: TetR/AcrR family transcriptional regulator [Myxococcota bacterium]
MAQRGYHHGDLREALLDAVIDVVASEGVGAVKVSALARACGVSSAAPFRHFPTREALLVAAAERAALEQMAAMDKAAANAPNPVEAERARGVAYVRWAVLNPGAFRLLDQPQIIQASSWLGKESSAFVEQLDAVLGERDESRSAPALTQRTAAALAAQALVYGLARMVVDGSLGSIDEDQAEQLAWEVTGVLGVGLRGS